jgi:type I restriction enzyme R subunit
MAKSEIERIKKIANELLTRLKTEKLKIDNWRAKQATRDAIRTEILDFLYDERTGLSTACYTEDEVKQRAEQVYLHVYRLVQDYQPKPYI